MLFEFPLNEKTRNYLRLENLLTQIVHAQSSEADSCMRFFGALFELLELLERLDVRQDLIKDLERLEADLSRWQQLPEVNQQSVASFRAEISRLLSILRGHNRLTSELKKDRFLASIRQRFAIPGGCCGFDLPQLQLWLNRPVAERQQHMGGWIQQLSTLHSSINICLQVLREKGRFVVSQSKAGFFQDNAEGKQMVRIRLDQEANCYPNVSGNKHRYSVRFQQFSDEGCSAVEYDIPFEVAAC